MQVARSTNNNMDPLSSTAYAASCYSHWEKQQEQHQIPDDDFLDGLFDDDDEDDGGHTKNPLFGIAGVV